MNFKYHFFIAHSSKDTTIARELYYLLHPFFHVFLAAESLKPGDKWDEVIPEAQFNSSATVLLITENSDKSFYQMEEVANAIQLLKEQKSFHTVIPVYIGDKHNATGIPYGLRRIHGVFLGDRLLRDIVSDLRNAIMPMLMDNLFPAKSSDYKEEIENSENKKDVLLNSKGKKIAFEKSIKQIIKMHYQSKQSTYIVYFDIDNFKAINRVHGEQIGDKVLLTIRQIIEPKLANHYYYNINSDEFISCLKFSNENDTIGLINDLKRSIADYDWTFLSASLFVTASFGYAELELPKKLAVERLMNEWIVKAIHGCFKAKRNGGNCYFKGPLALPKYISTDYREYGS